LNYQALGDMIHIVHIIPTLGSGGAESMLFRLLLGLSGRKYRHSIITLLESPCVHDLKAVGVDVHCIGMSKRGTLKELLKSMQQISVKLNEMRPDVVQGWMYHANLVALLSAPRHVAVLWGVHHSLDALRKEKFLTVIMICLGAVLSRISKVKGIVYPSGCSRRQHERIGYEKRKSISIPNGYDCVLFDGDNWDKSMSRARFGIRDDEFVVGNFGRYHKVKNHRLLIHAFSLFCKESSCAKLVLAGKGVDLDNSELIALINEFNVMGRVILLGEQSGMPELYAILDLYVLASISEAFPNVLCEAMASRVPVISTRVGDAVQMLGEHGVLLEVNDPILLSNLMISISTAPPDRLRLVKESGRQRVLDRYEISKVCDMYAALFDGVRNPVGH